MIRKLLLHILLLLFPIFSNAGEFGYDPNKQYTEEEYKQELSLVKEEEIKEDLTQVTEKDDQKTETPGGIKELMPSVELASENPSDISFS